MQRDDLTVDSRGKTALGKAVFLQTTAVFHQAPTETINALGAMAREVAVPAGAVIFRQEEPADAFYVVVAGRVRQERNGVVVRWRAPREVFGLWSAFDGLPRCSAAVAPMPADLLRVAYADLQDLLLGNVCLGLGLHTVLAQEISELLPRNPEVLDPPAGTLSEGRA
jgi:CRP-like cAMP-binding protein